jgi:hypothetical protein
MGLHYLVVGWKNGDRGGLEWGWERLQFEELEVYKLAESG